jgi:hypothetical protein
MSDDSDELPIASDNFIVASEVMSSAIRILALLDLDDRQIADLFVAEAGEGTAHDHSLPAVDDEGATDARPWRLHTLVENESFSKEIERFAKRVSALRTDREPGPGEVRKPADLCLGVIPALAAATACVSPARLRSMYRLTWRSVIRCPGISLPPAIAGGRLNHIHRPAIMIVVMRPT